MSRAIVVGHSGGVTSAWALGWALREYPRNEVVALFHDTKREDADTYRFLYEIADKLCIDVTEQSDGRSVEEVEDDEGALANNRMAFCSRILKAEQRDNWMTVEERATSKSKRILPYLHHQPRDRPSTPQIQPAPAGGNGEANRGATEHGKER